MTIQGTFIAEYSGTLEVKASPIEGDGLFSLVSFSTGDLILSSFGVGFLELGFSRETTQRSDYAYASFLRSRSDETQAKLILATNEFKFLNHSIDSNVKVLDNYKTYATQDIAIGDELTLNYNYIGYYD
jgi:SET domain-containing protein